MRLRNKDRGQWIILVAVVSGILFVAVIMLKRVPVSYYAYNFWQRTRGRETHLLARVAPPQNLWCPCEAMPYQVS